MVSVINLVIERLSSTSAISLLFLKGLRGDLGTVDLRHITASAEILTRKVEPVSRIQLARPW